jgi:methionine-rich copper-binding protein CopC
MKRFIYSALAAGLAATVLSLSPAAAWAHDEVAGTTPTAGTSVSAGVIDVGVAFGEDIMNVADNAGIAIQVTGPANAQDVGPVAVSCVDVAGANMSAQAELVLPGTYTVTWRAISSDGHANSGSFDFNVTNDNGYTSTNGVVDCSMARVATPLIAPNPMESETAVAISAKATAPDPFLQNLPFLIFGILLIVAGSAAGPLVARAREKRERDRALAKEIREEMEREGL